MAWEMVIGFEVHTELKTKSKVFCGCGAEFGQPPNTQTCPVCLGMPGTLPVLNRESVNLSLRTAMALNCKIPERCHFDRKNYYYPDLPKNYQISQHHRNLGTGGWIDIDLGDAGTKRIGIDNIHLEEDAGKNFHPEGSGVNYTLVDLNRAGTSLLEIVTAPDIRTREEAFAFMQGMRQFLEYLDVSECKMQEGRLRFELNISFRRAGDPKYGTKVEVKNLNSVSAIMKCIDAEEARQIPMLERGEKVEPQTRLWDEAEGITRPMRSKEAANDYRYFPEPDLVELHIDPAWRDEIAKTVVELPVARKNRFVQQYELSHYDAALLTAQVQTARFFEAAVAAHPNAKGVANWTMGEVLRALKDLPEDSTVEDLKIKPEALAELVRLIDKETITGKIAKQLFPMMLETGKMPSVLVEEKGLKPIDDSALAPMIDEVLAANAEAVAEVRAGKMKAMGFIMGEVMKKTKGKANPASVQPLLKKKLGIE